MQAGLRDPYSSGEFVHGAPGNVALWGMILCALLQHNKSATLASIQPNAENKVATEIAIK
jgi:hypothetical protein